MKTWAILLECAHNVVTQFPNAVDPTSPRAHVICKACGGGHFAVLRATDITNYPGMSWNDEWGWGETRAASKSGPWPWREAERPASPLRPPLGKDWAWNKAA
jgi:hypothetical protein